MRSWLLYSTFSVNLDHLDSFSLGPKHSKSLILNFKSGRSEGHVFDTYDQSRKVYEEISEAIALLIKAKGGVDAIVKLRD